MNIDANLIGLYRSSHVRQAKTGLEDYGLGRGEHVQPKAEEIGLVQRS
jgi:hypothetical protein